MEKNPLPSKPSELIRVALADLAKCEAMPETYRIDMSVWHLALDNSCHICLAGAVMAQTLGVEPGYDYWPEVSDTDIYCRLIALNAFRQGLVQQGLFSVGCNLGNIDPWKITDYKADPIQFRKDMEKLADWLESQGV